MKFHLLLTPFARIDTEHRRNIAKYFFSQLKGQVFILSTNEEINSSHIQILKDKIASTYLLENSDNKRTIIVRDLYFEVGMVFKIKTSKKQCNSMKR